MTHIEQVIKDATEKGGYTPCEFTPYSSISCGTQAQQSPVTHVWFNNVEGEGCGFPIWQIFLDPTFWQALGKARGWHDNEWDYDNKREAWKGYWHGLIDHLIEGKDAESFFTDLK